MSKESEKTSQDPLVDKDEEASQDPLAAKDAETSEETSEETSRDPLADKGGKSAADPSNATLAKALDALNATLSQRAVTPEQQEQAWVKLEEELGVSRKQILAQDQRARQIALHANLEANKELGRLRAGKILGEGDADLLDDIEKTMAGLPPEIQSNPKAWEDAADLTIGRKTRMTTKKSNTPDPQRRIVGGSAGGQTQGKPPAGKKGESKQYTSMETALIARQFGGKAEEYEKYKENKSIETDVKVTAGSNANPADQELQRLTANNT